jgi:hypothetical protein
MLQFIFLLVYHGGTLREGGYFGSQFELFGYEPGYALSMPK